MMRSVSSAAMSARRDDVTWVAVQPSSDHSVGGGRAPGIGTYGRAGCRTADEAPGVGHSRELGMLVRVAQS